MTMVMKFGGTSVGDAAAMKQAASLVRSALPRSPLVVLSAMSGITNTLFAAAEAAAAGDAAKVKKLEKKIVTDHRTAADGLFADKTPEGVATALRVIVDEVRVLLRGVLLLRELTPRTMDAVASAGERMSSTLFAAYLESLGIPTVFIDARDVMRTDARFGSARPQHEAIAENARQKIAPVLAAGRAVVTQGYIGSTDAGLTTTLGRGGSDYSAALFGAALAADEVQIWTDVEGILTADPRIVPEAVPIKEISFAEAAELAAFGAKVLHPATIQPAVENAIPVTVRHTHRPEGSFTLIKQTARSSRPVTALATRGPVTVLTVSSTRMLDQSGFLARLFEIFGRLAVSVDLVATAEVSVSLTIEGDAPLDLLTTEIKKFATVEIKKDCAILAIVGERIRDTRGISSRVFGALGDTEIAMISMGANEINLSLVVKRSDAPAAMKKLHRELFESKAFVETAS
jgi:aspartate kinase